MMTEADRVRIKAAAKRVLAVHRGPVIIVQSAPLHFASRPPPYMPEYMHPDFGRRTAWTGP
jgi:hypothetical protein